MFLTSILVKVWEILVAYYAQEEEDATGCCTGTGTGDRFSELPDALLLNILERVGTLDAVRACVLSSHLLKLPAMLPRIDIDVCHVSLEHHDSPNDLYVRGMARANRAVADLTDKILTTRPPQLTIRDLKLTFVLRHDDCLSIGRSVAGALATRRKVDALHFKILTEKDSVDCTRSDLVRFGRRFIVFFAACQDAFDGLTVLDLRNLRFREQDLPNILATCKRLEYLRLQDCDAGTASVLRIEHHRLIKLKIKYGKFRNLELCRLPKLQRITYNPYWHHDGNPLVFGFVPHLSKLRLVKSVVTRNTTIQLSQLLANVSSICDMRLDFQSEKIWVRPEIPRVLSPMLDKLRIVNLDNIREGCDITWTMFILEATPFLEELCITVWDHWCQRFPHQARSKRKQVRWKPCDDSFIHENLAKLTIFGFQPDDNFMGYVAHVMNATRMIKEVSLHDRKVCDLCVEHGIEVCPSRYPRTSKDKDLCIEKIMEGLAMGSPEVIHFLS